MSLLSAEALLFGLALGDALGYPTEFLSLKEIKVRYGAQGIQELPTPALYTDDTQMTIALINGLLDAGLTSDVDDQMRAIAHYFIQWLNSPENNRAPGNTCLAATCNLAAGQHWRQSGLPSKGCGAAMRVAPLGYFYQFHPDMLYRVADATAIITHNHPTARAAAIAAAYLVKLALDGVPPEAYLREVMAFTDGLSDEFDYTLLRVGHVLAWNDEESALNHIGQGWVADEAVALALYCVMRYPDDYVACVRRAANSQGDSDSIACIAGGISAARLGLEAIPQEWRERCERRDTLQALARQMAEARGAIQENS